MKITVVGLGYVGMSLSVLLSQKYQVVALDINNNTIKKINLKQSPIKDNLISNYLLKKKLKLLATNNKSKAYKDAEYVIISTPTDYDEKTGSFDTSTVEQTIKDAIKFNKKCNIVIKSTIPLGFTDYVSNKFKNKNIFFSPEFLREGNALFDNLYPSRIVIGSNTSKAAKFGEILFQCSSLKKNKKNIITMTSREAEAVKLFSNTYLAMRIAYFNELDTFSEANNLSSSKIINGVSYDPRIGNYYNNPSFGYGGYCLPKDIKQLLKNFKNIPNSLIKATIESNKKRKIFIVQSILAKDPKSVGIFKLSMKKNSDNFRESAVFDIIKQLKKRGIKIYLYEPKLETPPKNIEQLSNLDDFIRKSDIIIANRKSKELDSVSNKVYSRDIFCEN